MKNELRNILREIKLYRSVMADPGCPRRARWLLGAAIAYALSPIDIIPDFIPVIGFLDDILIVPLLVRLAIKSVPKEVILECRRRMQEEERHDHRQ